MTRIETETPKKLGTTVKAAVVNYPSWFQHEAIKRQFRGPLAIPMRSVLVPHQAMFARSTTRRSRSS